MQQLARALLTWGGNGVRDVGETTDSQGQRPRPSSGGYHEEQKYRRNKEQSEKQQPFTINASAPISSLSGQTTFLEKGKQYQPSWLAAEQNRWSSANVWAIFAANLSH
ncbi:hypothetical protein ACOMHN_010937 [Nucella lapillus]